MDPKHNIHYFTNDEIVYEKFISEGKYGKVYLGKIIKTNESVAVKEVEFLNYKLISSSIDEIAILHKLCHPNVLLFLGIIQNHNKILIVTEFASGGSLEKIILDRNIELSWKRRIEIAIDIARGMKYLNEQGILHRDLKSDNCLIKQNGVAVIADFGLSKIIRPNQLNSSRQRRHTIVGSIFSMAPEVINCKKYNFKADVYSFGIILCELINRVGSDPDLLIRYDNFGVNLQIFKESYQDMCPGPLIDITLKCCEFDPDKRPEISEIIEVMESINEF